MKKLFLFLLFQTFVIIVVYSQNVKTPKGSNVQAGMGEAEWSNSDRAYWDDYYRTHYDQCTIINTYGGRSTTKKFNCHGYAWHISEHVHADSMQYNVDKYRWIDSEEIYWDKDDGSYIERQDIQPFQTIQKKYLINQQLASIMLTILQ